MNSYDIDAYLHPGLNIENKLEGGLRMTGHNCTKIDNKCHIINDSCNASTLTPLADTADSTNLPLITIVTVVFNCSQYLEKTIESIVNQTYLNIEYIVIDGGSKDGTLDILRKYENKIDLWISESDRGIYDAMNKGIRLARGEWLCFMNAGDCFFDANTLADISFSLNNEQISFVYSDTLLWNTDLNVSAGIYNCDHKRRNLIHQSVVYRKKLHQDFGPYLVAKNVTISDYLFFCLIPDEVFYKTEKPIAIYQLGGASNTGWSRDQKFLIDWLTGRMGKLMFLLHIILYPLRQMYKNFLLKRKAISNLKNNFKINK